MASLATPPWDVLDCDALPAARDIAAVAIDFDLRKRQRAAVARQLDADIAADVPLPFDGCFVEIFRQRLPSNGSTSDRDSLCDPGSAIIGIARQEIAQAGTDFVASVHALSREPSTFIRET